MTSLRYPVLEPDLGEKEERYVLDAVRSGWVSSIGPYVERFEREFASFVGVEHCVAVANGTVALHLALVARGIGPGDEVIVPDLTFAATAAAVVHAGATPVLVDVRRDDWTIDPELVARAKTPRTRALIPVHLYGCPARMTEIRDAVGPDVFVLEDAAEAHGARDSAGRTVGSIGDAGAFSFYGNKLLTTGEGGALTTRDPEFAARARYLKDHAMSPQARYFHTEAGFNYRLTNLQAALGCAQLESLGGRLAQRARILEWYREALAGSPIELNPAPADRARVCWLTCALLPTSDVDVRDRVAAALRGRGIDTRPFFVPMHRLPPYRECRHITRGGSVAEDLFRRGLSLPTLSKLTRDDVGGIAGALRDAIG